MAVFTKLNQADIYNVQNIFGFKRITSFKGIKKGIENTNYTVATKNKKYVLTIFESRVNNKAVSYTHLRAHETGRNLVCRLLLEKKKKM